MMKKVLYGFLAFIILLVGIYLVGPTPDKPVLDPSLPELSVSIDELDQYIHDKEFSHPSLKPDNEARIIWADSVRQPTEYSLVFLPGFSATQGEGEPIHLEFSKRYGCNAYLARLYAHGLDSASGMGELTPDKYLETAKEAIAIGQKIGDKVIVMSSSTGGTLALYLAAHHPQVYALICYSPNVRIYDPKAGLLTKPWGFQIGKLVSGSEFRDYDAPEEFKKYWTTKTHLNALIAVQSLVENTMRPDVFEKINQPLFMGYYYKNEEEQDKVVSVDAMQDMYNRISTPENMKRKRVFPEAGRHVLCSKYATHDYSGVMKETFKFTEEVLGLQPL